MLHDPSREDRPKLRLFTAADLDDDGCLSPHITLGEFFDRWYFPVVLVGGGAADSTAGLFRDALRWWGQLSGDPPLRLIDEYTLARFAAGLREATYKRGTLGQPRPLTKSTIARHLRFVRQVLERAGPTVDPKKPGKGLIGSTPLVEVPRPKVQRRATFSWETIVALLERAESFRAPRGCHAPVDWWRACWGLMLYTGYRIDTIRQLTRAMLHTRGGQVWLSVPEWAVPKTEKSAERVLHPSAVEAIDRVQGGEELLPPIRCFDSADKWHRELQREAGVTQPMGWNAWRRTHAALLVQCGYNAAMDIARRALDHSDERTTRDYYCDPVNDFLLRLPPLPPRGGERQLSLF